MGTTHHEGGTLRMGDNAASSVTNADGRFHGVSNAYVAGPALFATVGSPNPMLTGIALARRTGDIIMRPPPQPILEQEFQSLFDGTRASFKRWETAGEGQFSLIDGAIVTYPGAGLGLLWFPALRFGDFTLRLEFRIDDLECNAGVFVRSRNPRLPVPRRDGSGSDLYVNKAWVPVTTGFEIQIDEQARPAGLDQHRTGAIYDIPLGVSPGHQAYRRGPALIAGQWYELEIDANGDQYTARVAGQLTSTFSNNDAYRGRGAQQIAESGYIGLQSHTGRVRFRHIRARNNVNATPVAELAKADVLPSKVRTPIGERAAGKSRPEVRQEGRTSSPLLVSR